MACRTRANTLCAYVAATLRDARLGVVSFNQLIQQRDSFVQALKTLGRIEASFSLRELFACRL
jgi:hypothetical protein